MNSNIIISLDKKLQEKHIWTPYLEKAEAITGLRRLYLVLGAGGLWALYMIFGYFAELVCNLVGFAYPAYCSITALETTTKEDDSKWLTYWIVFACFSVIEFFADIIVVFIPFYYLLKVGFLIWCFFPMPNNGSTVIYKGFVKPFFIKAKASIEKNE